MSDFKEKTQTFVFGMLVGLVIAGSFFIFKLDAYIEKLKLYKNITKTLYLDRSKNQKDDREKSSKKTEEKLSTINYKKEKDKKRIKNRDYSKALSEEQMDTTGYDENDSTTVTNYFNEEDDIVIEKDQLVSSVTTQITNLNIYTQAEQTADSLLQKVSKIRDDNKASSKTIIVELWKSPLHYKGYKMSKNKLVLYGLNSLEEIKLYKLDNTTYMKLSSVVYKLEQNPEYKSYQHVDDVAIVNKLKG